MKDTAETKSTADTRTVNTKTADTRTVDTRYFDSTLIKPVLPGQELVCIGEIATAGADVLMATFQEDMKKRFSDSFCEEETAKLHTYMAEAARAIQPANWPETLNREYGVSKCMHVEKGGILAALWDFLSEEGIDRETGRKRSDGLGCEFTYEDIPIRQYVMEVCELFDVLPYRLLSDCYLVAADHGERLAEHFRKQGISAAVFGFATKGPKRIRTDGVETAFLTKEHTEELERKLGKTLS